MVSTTVRDETVARFSKNLKAQDVRFTVSEMSNKSVVIRTYSGRITVALDGHSVSEAV